MARRLIEERLNLLTHVSRFVITRPRAIRKRVWPELSRIAITKRISRTCHQDMLVRHQIGTQMYYRLGKMAERYVPVSHRLLTSPGPQAFELHRAVLHYCCLGPRPIDRLTPGELREAFPKFPESELYEPYYLDPKGYLGLLRLVHATKQPTRAIRDCEETVLRRIDLGEPFEQLMANGKFLVVLMTQSDAQTAAIKRKLGPPERWTFRRNWPPITIRVHTLPEA